MRALAVCLALLSLARPALAESDPDTEVARRHFERGRAFYAAEDYLHALEEFKAARSIRARPALDFNIGRCHDRMGHWDEAVIAYQRYLETMPPPKDAPEVRERISVLQTRQSQKTPPPAPQVLVSQSRPKDEKLSKRTLALAIGIPVGVVVLSAVIIGLAFGLRSEESYSLGSTEPQ